ncbi:hypothetical protein BKA69DRAFT_295934 [Paraphysoderma sedebokerense]|nr:hypothetical protein BKA69DRAFT_295934 [Paraphysoderma sedebokerense]
MLISSFSLKSLDYEFELKVSSQPEIPLLLVGTKADLLNPTEKESIGFSSSETSTHRRRYSIIDEYGGEAITMSTYNPPTQSHRSLSAFFNSVIESKFFPSMSSTSSNNATIPHRSQTHISTTNLSSLPLSVSSSSTLLSNQPLRSSVALSTSVPNISSSTSTTAVGSSAGLSPETARRRGTLGVWDNSSTGQRRLNSARSGSFGSMNGVASGTGNLFNLNHGNSK